MIETMPEAKTKYQVWPFSIAIENDKEGAYKAMPMLTKANKM